MNTEQILKLKIKLLKKFTEFKEIEKVGDIKNPFFMDPTNTIGIMVKNNELKKELLPFFCLGGVEDNGLKSLSFADNKGSFFDTELLKYCIDLMAIFSDKKSTVAKEKGFCITSGHNKPIVLENEYIKLYFANIYQEEGF